MYFLGLTAPTNNGEVPKIGGSNVDPKKSSKSRVLVLKSQKESPPICRNSPKSVRLFIDPYLEAQGSYNQTLHCTQSLTRTWLSLLKGLITGLVRSTLDLQVAWVAIGRSTGWRLKVPLLMALWPYGLY